MTFQVIDAVRWGAHRANRMVGGGGIPLFFFVLAALAAPRLERDWVF